ncbi:selenium metabolism-associated LysR family transcriptional regulator [Blautia luti]|uniref:LysR family transcriptional regulator n=1 Tax=Blautia luti DSM 14534 = JCM 17040 TaxID=649762 RepID=A0A844GLY5_9FIRM|nr:selenium metabolism-associated LysR family transcriptional regulator [Blautia luti]MTD61267.1 LysR family transcriptional regulator [Blautia luti DSM 14534 = JCM 17040]BEI61276.1 selenium metabolism-associated LysR family transcriptional regulator [Blautia luti]
MEFKQLEAFVAVVDYGSFSEAARKLYLTQPTISTHIRSLEEELHTRLIIRTTKKLTITPKGYQLYDSAVRMLDIRNNLFENFTGSKKQIIDLAASTIPSSYLLPELMAGFGRMYPDVYFHSWQTDSAGAISRVLDGSVDLALTGQNTGDDSCIFIPFCQDDMVIATPVNDHYLQLKERPVTFSDFLKDPIIIRERGSGTKKEMDIFLENAGIEPSSLNVVARMNDLESIKKSIVNGLGISILSARSAVDLKKTKQILLFPLEGTAHKRSFYIVCSKNRILKAHVRQFIQYVKNYYL